MMKIDKWHVILFIIAIAGILGSGFFLGQATTAYQSTTTVEKSLDKAEKAYKESLEAQTEITKRLVDSLATSNQVTNTNVQGDWTSKGNKNRK